jgi:hypothetical protein
MKAKDCSRTYIRNTGSRRLNNWLRLKNEKQKIYHSQNNSKIQQEIIEDRGFDRGVLCTC